MKASQAAQAKLLELQALDTRINQLNHRSKMLPELATLAALDSENAALRAELLGASGAVEDAKLELGRIESDVTVVEARIARDVDRLQTSTSVKDVAGLESELAGLRRRQLELEEIELGVMERLDLLESTAEALRGRNADLAGRVTEVTTERDAALGVIFQEAAAAGDERSAIAVSIPEDLRALYEKQRARYGSGAALLRGGTSTASGVKFNENDMEAIRTAAPDDVLLCPDSNAILVRTAESGL